MRLLKKISPLFVAFLCLILMSVNKCQRGTSTSGGSYSSGGSGPLSNRNPDAAAVNNWLGEQLSVNPSCIGSGRLHDTFAKEEFPLVPPRKKPWKKEWSQHIKKVIQTEHRELLSMDINEKDLDALGCPGFKNANEDDKIKFWVGFFAALIRMESGNDPGTSYAGISYGLLQLGTSDLRKNQHGCAVPRTSRGCSQKNACGKLPSFNPRNEKDSLTCGISMMSNQMKGIMICGSKRVGGRLKPSELKNRLFPKRDCYWGPLTRARHPSGSAHPKNKDGKMLTDFFKNLSIQMPFCRATPIDRELGQNNEEDCSIATVDQQRIDGKIIPQEGTSESSTESSAPSTSR